MEPIEAGAVRVGARGVVDKAAAALICCMLRMICSKLLTGAGVLPAEHMRQSTLSDVVHHPKPRKSQKGRVTLETALEDRKVMWLWLRASDFAKLS